MGRRSISSTGNPHGMMDCIRHAGFEAVMQTLIQDLRYSVRQLIKNPGVTLTAVISLALGIGATTAVFSVIYAALIDPYPFPAAGPHCADVGEDQGRIGGYSQFEPNADPAIAASGRHREHAGDGLPRHDDDGA